MKNNRLDENSGQIGYHPDSKDLILIDRAGYRSEKKITIFHVRQHALRFGVMTNS
jgi:hypothetical protein